MSNLNLPEGWKLLSLSQLGSFSKGKGITKNDLQDNGLPCIRYGEIYTLHHNSVKKFYSYINSDVASTSKKLQFNDLLFAGSGETIEEIGKAVGYRLEKEAFAGGDIVILSLLNQYRADYIAYYLNSFGRKQLNKLGAGHSVVHIYAKDLEKILIPIPPINIQEPIVNTLEQWDTAIEKTEALLAAKERQFGWLRKRLFEGASNKTIVTLSSIITFTDGYPFLSSEYSEDGIYNILTIANVQYGSMACSFKGKIMTIPKKVKNEQILELGDVLISMTGNVGRICKVDIPNCLLNQRVGKLTARKCIDHDFLYYSLLNERFLRKMLAHAQGGAQGNLSKNDILKYTIILPPLEEQKRIAHILNTAQQEITLLKKLAAQYRTQKRGLMQKLLSG